MNSEYILTSDGELYHWGIKGMKWGIRRYQTKDGSLTPAGKKRYDKDMAKIKAETQKLKNQQRTDKKISKLEEAKKNLAALKIAKKKGKDLEEEEKKQRESDQEKRDRILNAPTPKDVYDNRHLFNNNEIQALSLRLMNENNIKNLVPKEVDKGKKFIDDAINTGETIAKAVDTGSKTWNSVAKVYNSLIGRKNGVELPTISDKTVSKLDKYKEETDWIKAKNERKKAQKEADDEKTELELLKEQTAQIKADNEYRKAQHTREQYDKGNWNNKEDKPEKKKDEEEDDD